MKGYQQASSWIHRELQLHLRYQTSEQPLETGTMSSKDQVDQAPPQQYPPQMHHQGNLYQYPPPPQQNVNFVRAPGMNYTKYCYQPINPSFLWKVASFLDPGQLALSGLQALFQQQGGAGHPVYPQHPQAGAPPPGGYPRAWN